MREAFGTTFDVPPGYLNTAAIGVPATATAAAVGDAVARWGRGGIGPGDFDEAVEAGRRGFARLIGVDAARVAIGSTASQLVGAVAAGLPAGSRVLVLRGEFTSVSFPFAAQADRGVRVEEVGAAEFADRAPGHDLVAISAVQSADGWRVDLDALRAARAGGTRVLLDVSQVAGWAPLELDWADYVVGVGYKWLLAPRGAAWLSVHPDAPPPRPDAANWFAAHDPSAMYGLPLRLAGGPAGLDLSPVWFAQVGAGAALDWLTGLDLAEVAAHCTGLADRFRGALGMAPAGSAIVAVDRPDAAERLARAGVRCSARAGAVRLSFHLYNTEEDVDLAVRALGG
ncbi:aminotransferase class V-fold PLP-dependent enzyme [Saccharopolyspora sp. CA-218241]|uniref:aminotransferase class V-fold PLP-dependent enzyme n=1 Tax=Saccharopolyspora sp. CA-218241 TaxID=3240027 RepID=UPI003D97C512